MMKTIQIFSLSVSLSHTHTLSDTVERVQQSVGLDESVLSLYAYQEEKNLILINKRRFSGTKVKNIHPILLTRESTRAQLRASERESKRAQLRAPKKESKRAQLRAPKKESKRAQLRASTKLPHMPMTVWPKLIKKSRRSSGKQTFCSVYKYVDNNLKLD